MRVLAALCCLSVAAALHDSFINVETFDGFRVFRTVPKTLDDVAYLNMMQGRPFYDFWTEVVQGRNVDIMVPPKYIHQMEADFSIRGMSYEVMIPNVQDLIELEKVKADTKEAVSADHPMTWTEYHPLEDMYSFLDYLEATYDFVSTEVIGKSGQGREMRIAKVCKGECGSKPAVWIDGGIHAREWVSPATVTWMLRELVENDAAHPDLLEGLDWYAFIKKMNNYCFD